MTCEAVDASWGLAGPSGACNSCQSCWLLVPLPTATSAPAVRPPAVAAEASAVSEKRAEVESDGYPEEQRGDWKPPRPLFGTHRDRTVLGGRYRRLQTVELCLVIGLRLTSKSGSQGGAAKCPERLSRAA